MTEILENVKFLHDADDADNDRAMTKKSRAKKWTRQTYNSGRVHQYTMGYLPLFEGRQLCFSGQRNSSERRSNLKGRKLLTKNI